MNVKAKYEIPIGVLYTIYSAGFNHGSNEGSFPEHGTFAAFERLMKGESPMEDGVCYKFQDKIKLIE